jgi:hypothetical protein
MTEPAKSPPPPEWTPPEGDEEALRQWVMGQAYNLHWRGVTNWRAEG